MDGIDPTRPVVWRNHASALNDESGWTWRRLVRRPRLILR